MTDSNTYMDKAKAYLTEMERRFWESGGKTDERLASITIISALMAIAERLAPLEVPEITENLVKLCPECGGGDVFDRNGEDVECPSCRGTHLASAPPKPEPSRTPPFYDGPIPGSSAKMQ